jgi:hypothetical protein
VRRTPFALAALVVPLAFAAVASASPVLVVDGSRAAVRDDPFLPPPAPDAPGAGGLSRGAPAGATAAAAKPKRTFKGELRRYLRAGELETGAYDRARRAYDRARRAARGLTGQRATELGAVLATVDWIVGAGRLEPSRVPALTLTLERNRRLWASTATLPPARGRVEFAGSELVWEYYAGQGLQLQPLGTFGKANGLWTAGDQDARLRALFEEMLPLAAQRGKALAWEYYFFFGGGRPPWASGMAQATGLQALSRAITRLGVEDWRAPVPRLLTLFRLRSPIGVRVPTSAGAHYLQYSFSPGTRIINAFLQSVIGLYETGEQLGDQLATRLAELGDAQARVELPLYDTGAWSLYDLGGGEAPLAYHRLARSFLKRLCDRLAATVYCDGYQHWTDYLRNPPETRLVTTSAPAAAPIRVRFRLDKASNVGMAIDDPAGRNVFFAQGDFAHGTRFVTWTPPAPGAYALRISAKDLAGNEKETAWTLEVTAAAPPARP